MFSLRPSPHRSLLWIRAKAPAFLAIGKIFGSTKVIGITNDTTGQLVLWMRA